MPTTTNYSWTLPTVGGSVNTWGTLVNAVLTDIDAKMPNKTAPVFTGGMTLSGGASITGNSTVAGTLGVSDNLTLGATDGKIFGGTTVGRAIWGNSNLATYVTAYGATHATNANQLLFVAGSTAVGTFSSTGLAVTGALSATDSVTIKKSGGLIEFRQADNSRTGYIQEATGNLAIVAERASSSMQLYTNNTLQATLDTSGKLGVNCIPAYRFHVSESIGSAYTARFDNTHASQPYGLSVFFSAASPNNTTNTFLICSDNTADRLRIYSNGNVVNTLNSYGAISDLKLKQDITDATPKLAKLLKVRIVNYKLKADPNGIKQIGVIAQELEEISPGLIEETPDFEEVTLTREVNKTVPVTVKKEVTSERIQFEVIEGVAVQTVVKEAATIDDPVVDEYPVFDGDGNPVMEVVTPATDAEIDAEGNEVKAAAPAVLRQKIHTVPRMETVVEKEEYTERRPTGTTTKSVKYSIFVPMLIKAMQEQQAQIEALKAKVGA